MVDNEIISISTKMPGETLWTQSSDQIWSKISFNIQAYLKGRGTCVHDQIWQV
jgi:hypothetical protein